MTTEERIAHIKARFSKGDIVVTYADAEFLLSLVGRYRSALEDTEDWMRDRIDDCLDEDARQDMIEHYNDHVSVVLNIPPLED